MFDDKAAATLFCRRYLRACHVRNFVRLDLKSLIGDSAYEIAQGMLRTGGFRSRERLRDQLHGNDKLAHECFPKYGGQCYQSLKKFYGAAQGPSHCRFYWVSDAESFPFRPFNLSALIHYTTRPQLFDRKHRSPHAQHSAASLPFQLIPSWFPNRHGCTATTNLFDDGDCAVWIASTLALGNGSGGIGYLSSTRRAYQTVYDLNNWWMYDVQMARALIDRTEEVQQKHFVSYFASLQVPDILFWRANFEYLAQQPGSPMQARNFIDLVEHHFPAAFAACCSCHRSSATNESTPCYALRHLWTPCFRAHAPSRRLADFLVERLGIFGIFGNEMDLVPDSVLRADSRLSWVVNNGYKWRASERFMHNKT